MVCGGLSIIVPSSWISSEGVVPNVARYAMASDDESMESHVYFIYEWGYSSNLDFVEKNMVMPSMKDGIFKNGVKTGGRERMTINKQEVSRLEITSAEFMDISVEGYVYIVCAFDKSYAVFCFHKKGLSDVSSSIIKTMTVQPVTAATYKSAREELQEFFDGLSSYFPMSIDDGAGEIHKMRFNDAEKSIEYTISISSIDKKEFSVTELEKMKSYQQKEGKTVIKALMNGNQILKRCVNEGYGFTIIYWDKNLQFLTKIHYNSKDLK